ncbi:hypothetical protein EVAR_41897_1 [Eumeta japonica]|uniref:Uncharacterized protein n=1 Tax=Eumeta variegata TaxID=151549 RepID=A0A4C1YM67_EUMVA|nr:hypothetical protein EVAR_41897_1 [Eumeta japonica]
MEIKPSHKAFWAVTKALKTEGYTLYPTQKPDNSVAIDDAEIAECLADSIETQCSHASPSRHRSYQSHRGRGSPKTSLEPKTIWLLSPQRSQTLVKSLNTRKAPGLDGGGGYRHPQARKPRPPASYRPISLLSGLGKLSRNLKTRLSDHLLGKALS